MNTDFLFNVTVIIQISWLLTLISVKLSFHAFIGNVASFKGCRYECQLICNFSHFYVHCWYKKSPIFTWHEFNLDFINRFFFISSTCTFCNIIIPSLDSRKRNLKDGILWKEINVFSSHKTFIFVFTFYLLFLVLVK